MHLLNNYTDCILWISIKVNFIKISQIHSVFYFPIRRIIISSTFSTETHECKISFAIKNEQQIRNERKDVIRMWKLDGNYRSLFYFRASFKMRWVQTLLLFYVHSTFISLSKLFISVNVHICAGCACLSHSHMVGTRLSNEKLPFTVLIISHYSQSKQPTTANGIIFSIFALVSIADVVDRLHLYSDFIFKLISNHFEWKSGFYF